MKGNNGTRICIVSILSVAIVQALSPTIGVASAIGSFVLNSNRVDGNANLFDGSEIKTNKASSQILLANGAALTLGIDSAATVYRDHLLLQGGATKVDDMNGFSVHAANLLVQQAQPASQAVLRLNGDILEVAALAGSLNVFDKNGALLTHIGAGTGSAFQTGASGGGRGTASPNNNNRIRREAAVGLLMAATLAGLGLAVAAIVQPAPTSH